MFCWWPYFWEGVGILFMMNGYVLGWNPCLPMCGV